jgi:hypothetical protein
VSLVGESRVALQLAKRDHDSQRGEDADEREEEYAWIAECAVRSVVSRRIARGASVGEA